MGRIDSGGVTYGMGEAVFQSGNNTESESIRDCDLMSSSLQLMMGVERRGKNVWNTRGALFKITEKRDDLVVTS